jgi:uncharacterized membrane protein YbhN (UPF0104 family)
MKKTLAFLLAVALIIVPALAMAQTTPNFNYITSWFTQATYWLRLAITVIMILMTFWFLLNVFRFIMEKDSGKVAERRSAMVRGLIGLFIAVAVWGIIRIAGSVFGVDTENRYQTPGITCPPGTAYDSGSATCRPR